VRTSAEQRQESQCGTPSAKDSFNDAVHSIEIGRARLLVGVVVDRSVVDERVAAFEVIGDPARTDSSRPAPAGQPEAC
jgi:hypothetical protein